MSGTPALIHSYFDACVEQVIDSVGPHLVMAIPLGLGKPNRFVNALYERVKNDPKLSLTIVTALTLERPQAKSELEKRFLNPFLDRILGDYPDLDYALDRRKNTLPKNIRVIEFFYSPGSQLGNPRAQQDYISSNYTHVACDMIDRGVNVLAQLVAFKEVDGVPRYSLSCNPDVTLELAAKMKRRRADGQKNILVAEINRNLPFMYHDAMVADDYFDVVVDKPDGEFHLFGTPRPSINDVDYMIGLNCSTLIKDGGTLQIGIGSSGDALAHALILRHRKNENFREIVKRLDGDAPLPIAPEDRPFDTGLYGLSEMLVDCFLDLIDAGVLKRAVDGVLLHAAFFLGPKKFYAALHDMPDSERARIVMKPVSWVNALYGEEQDKRHARVKARFINNAMMATLLGAVVSDGLEDGRVVSGVGGQHDFVVQSFALDGARSIITLDATRESGGKTLSNIRWSYAHQTIPRHLRDIIVTEYGVADLRGKSDAEVIAAMLCVTDSRFQDALLSKAKTAGKIDRGYEIPAAQR